MTIEEVIYALDMVEHIESISTFYDPGEPMNHTTVRELKEACRMAIDALRAQQTPAKLDRSRWEGCYSCGNVLKTGRMVQLGRNYCPRCGRPLTEEAWAELRKKIGGTTL